MPSLRGVSSHRPDAERRSGCCRRRRQLGTGAVLVTLLVAWNAAAQRAEEPRARIAGVAQASADGSQERPRVILLVRTDGDEGVMNRVRAELHAGAWQIVELRVEDRSARAPLGKLAAQQSVRAAVRFDPAEARIELWIFRPRGNLEESIASGGEREEDAVLALRITEELRARGLNLAPEGEPSNAAEAEQAPPAAANDEGAASREHVRKAETARARPRTARSTVATATRGPQNHSFSNELWLELGPALSGSPGGLGPTLAGWVSARLALTPRWSCSLLGVIPLGSQELRGSEGSAQVTTYLAGASSDVAWLLAPRWQLGVGAGVAWAQTRMVGAASSGYIGARDSVSAVAPLARATAQLQLAGRLWLGLGALAGVTFPEVSVKFGDRVAGHWGRPFVLATLDFQLLAARFSGTAPNDPAGP